MNDLLHFAGLEQAALPPQPLHLAIGMFDGVHRGHRLVIDSALGSARRAGGLAGVLTFWPHPSALIHPEKPTRLLMPPGMKRAVLGRLGLDFLIEQHFSGEFARTTAPEFVALLRRCLPRLTAVYVGENWRFGRDRTGDIKLLIAEARQAGLEVFSTPPLNHQGAPISSSRIRELLAAGEIAAANALLGYAYFTEGAVQRGRQLGRTIGFPTLNVAWEPELKPRFGVYAVEVSGRSGPPVKGVANYGLRPTVEQTDRPLLEVHLLAPSTLTYGDFVSVRWLQFLRPEAKFGDQGELQRQIVRDRENALKFLG